MSCEETARELMIEATGVQKVYDAGGLRVRALRGVDLGVRRGEMVAIMGPSGCGKTTLLTSSPGSTISPTARSTSTASP